MAPRATTKARTPAKAAPKPPPKPIITNGVIMPREVLTDIIFHASTKLAGAGEEEALADAIVDALDRRGMVIAEVGDVIDPPDEHMRLLKRMRTRILQDIENSETSSRDLAALTNRMQSLSKEINSIEERQRADNKSKENTHGGTGTTQRPETSGPLKL